MEATKIYILLPVHNRRDQTQRFVECLIAQTYQKYCLILIDDGSTDGTAEIIQTRIPSVKTLKGTGNWWWAGGLQQGINWLKQNSVDHSDIILMINDDVIFEPNFLETGIKILADKNRTLLCAQCFGQQTGRCLDAGVQFDYKTMTFPQESSPEKINCLSTMGLFLRFSDLLEIGDFYPRFLPHYLSDYEYTIRAHNKGFSLYTTPALKVWNNESTTGPREIKQLNLLKFLKTYFSNKFPGNPLTWSAFIILVYPKLWVPIRLLILWRNTFIIIVKQTVEVCFVYLRKALRLKQVI